MATPETQALSGKYLEQKTLGLEHDMSIPETQALSCKCLAGSAFEGEGKEQRAVGATLTALPCFASEATEAVYLSSSSSPSSDDSWRDSSTSQDLPDVLELQEVVEEMDRKELRDLAFPFLLADPSKPLCPVVACSDSFADLTGYDADETLGRKAAYHLRGQQAAQFLECSSRSELYGAFGRQSAAEWALGADDLPEEVGELGEGELLTAQNHLTGSGEHFSCVTFLKQVYIEDEMFVVALQASPEGSDDDSLQACVAQLKSNMEAVLEVLPALFWFSAPLSRLSNGRAPQASEFVYFSSEDSAATSQEDSDRL